MNVLLEIVWWLRVSTKSPVMFAAIFIELRLIMLSLMRSSNSCDLNRAYLLELSREDSVRGAPA